MQPLPHSSFNCTCPSHQRKGVHEVQPITVINKTNSNSLHTFQLKRTLYYLPEERNYILTDSYDFHGWVFDCTVRLWVHADTFMQQAFEAAPFGSHQRFWALSQWFVIHLDGQVPVGVQLCCGVFTYDHWWVNTKRLWVEHHLLCHFVLRMRWCSSYHFKKFWMEGLYSWTSEHCTVCSVAIDFLIFLNPTLIFSEALLTHELIHTLLYSLQV